MEVWTEGVSDEQSVNEASETSPSLQGPPLSVLLDPSMKPTSLRQAAYIPAQL